MSGKERFPLNRWSWGQNRRNPHRAPFQPQDFRDARIRTIVRTEFFEDAGAGPGDHTLEPAHFVDADTHYQHALHGQLAPAKLTNASSFYGAALNGRLDPAHLTNSSSFYQARLDLGLRPAKLLNASVFYTAALHGHLAPEKLINVSSFQQPTITFEPIEVTPPVIDGTGLRIIRKKRRHTPAHFKQRTPEDIRREQLEDERYLEELEAKKSTAPAVTGVPGPAAMRPSRSPAPVVPTLPDALARAVSVEQLAASAAAKAAAARRRTALLLLALD